MGQEGRFSECEDTNDYIKQHVEVLDEIRDGLLMEAQNVGDLRNMANGLALVGVDFLKELENALEIDSELSAEKTRLIIVQAGICTLALMFAQTASEWLDS
jgi:hypothetical protein